MLEKDYGADLARSVARILVVDLQRAGGQPQHSALLEMNPKSDRVQAVGLGPRQFSRAFRMETGMTPAKTIEGLRLDAARLMIEQSRHPIEVVAAETGFGDQERMRRAFLRVFGQSPQVLRRSTSDKAG